MAFELYLQGSCVGADKRGTGLSDCIAEEGEPTGFIKTSKGWNISTDSGALPTEEVYKQLVQARTFFPFRNKFEFEDQTPENGKETSSFGIEKTNLLAKPKLKFDFISNFEFHANAYDHLGYGQGDVALIFEKGIAFATDVSETKIKGFEGGDIDVSTYKFKSGETSAKTSIMFQLLNSEEYNKRLVFYTWEQLGYDANFINGIINTKLTYQTAPAAGTTLNVYVKVDKNRSVDVLGLTNANNWRIGGTQTTPASVSGVSYNAGGYYVLTLDNATVATDTIYPYLGDVSNSYEAASNASGDLYSGAASLATIS